MMMAVARHEECRVLACRLANLGVRQDPSDVLRLTQVKLPQKTRRKQIMMYVGRERYARTRHLWGFLHSQRVFVLEENVTLPP